MPVSPAYKPDPRFATLGPDFADPVSAARFPQHVLRFRNDPWAARVGLDTLAPEEWESAFARFEALPGNMQSPLAMRYHGHQFRVYNPDIGDGRGFLYAQLRDDQNRLLDLATKGSGQTPYSRFGDGRLTLKGGVREVLAAEMLAALGVKTSKAFTLFETGEALQRNDEPSPTRSAVLTRLSHSHIRFGTFQRLTYFERSDLIRVLIDHAVECYYPELSGLAWETRAGAFFEEIVEATARLAGSWMAAGFVHGVLNTDNMTITGESFDYGPWRFIPKSDPNFTAAYFDETGLYSFARQPEAASWNLAQLAGCFSLVCDTSMLEHSLRTFGPGYMSGLRDAMFARLGLLPGEVASDLEFLTALLRWMTETGAPWAQFFFDWFGGALSATRAAQSPAASFYAQDAFLPLRADIEKRSQEQDVRLQHPYFARAVPCDLLIDELEAIWAAIAERDDWTSFDSKIADVRLMGAALAIQTE